jgi:hypothetical protein
MSVCTLGFYELYWSHRNWRAIKERDNSDIMPLMRAIFGLFFVYALFKRMRADGQQADQAVQLSAGPLAAGWIITTLLHRLPPPYSMLAMLAILWLIPVQAFVNELNATVVPDHPRNDSFTAWNWVAIVLGGLCFVLATIGSFLPLRHLP